MISAKLTRYLSIALVTGVMLSGPGVATAKTTDRVRAQFAAGFLAGEQCQGRNEPKHLRDSCPGRRDRGAIPAFSPLGSTADAVVSLVAAKAGQSAVNRAIDYLKRKVDKVLSDPDVGLRGKVVMALVAAGRNPRRFAGTNLVKEITKLEQPDGRYGEDTEVFSQALLLLALVAADKQPSDVGAQWLVDAQCDDGGWQFDEPAGPVDDEHCKDLSDPNDFNTSDSNTTSLAVQALAALGVEPAADPFSFIESLRDDNKGGWGFTQEFTLTDANSTALVIQAYKADGQSIPSGGMDALRALQYPLCKKNHAAFAFSYEDNGNGGLKRTGPDVGATISAIPGLLRLPFPIAEREITRPALSCTRTVN
ncbi:MAG: hypothetical protein ACRDJB_13195 [Actinomycetota bacterium]